MGKRTENHLRHILADSLAELQRFAESSSLGDFQRDPRRQREVEYALLRAIAACMEWASRATHPHEVQFDKGLKTMVEQRQIDEALAVRLKEHVKFRHALAHLTEDLNPEDIFARARDLEALKLFALAVGATESASPETRLAWSMVETRYPPQTVVKGRVIERKKLYALVQLDGVEGEVPADEISWTRNPDPVQLLRNRQLVSAVVTNVNPSARKLLLSIKRLEPSPWDAFRSKSPPGSRVRGVVSLYLSDHGLVLDLEGGITGRVPKQAAVVSNPSSETANVALRNPHSLLNPYRTGVSIEATVEEIDEENLQVKLTDPRVVTT